jgi:predicted porin
MKKSLIALAVMAAAGSAAAQSSVTLFGIVDAAISRYATHGGTNNTLMTNSGYNSSRLGFRGTEDLGGGMSASFWLEGALSNDDGTVGKFDFRRRSTVSLGGGWGELRLGRDYTPTFFNGSVFDPFGTNGIGSNIVHKVKLQNTTDFPTTFDPNYVRADNMVSYFLPPNLGGFYGQISYALDEKAGNNAAGDAGRYAGIRAGYGSGPFNVALAYGRTEGSTALPEVKDWNIGGQWDFGMAKLLAYYDRAEYRFAADDEGELKSWLIGTLVPVGAGEIRASYSRSKFDDGERADQWALGYVHNLSKRTALYATIAQVRNRGDAALSVAASTGGAASVPGVTNARGRGFDIGIRHAF